MGLLENYNKVQGAMFAACARAKRDMGEVTLVAVTKFVPMERILPAFALGIAHVGENRAQEFREKVEVFKNNGCVCHFIGQLQTNKVKYVVGRADLIQSVDREELAVEINRQAHKENIHQDILIEVNIGGEAQKGGVPGNELALFIKKVSKMKNLRVKGLMCIPPLGPSTARPYFARMRELFEICRQYECETVSMQHLSMGMSGDFEAAIEEGATMIRVGSALFGARPENI